MSKFNLGRVTKLIFSGVVAAALTVLIGWYTLELAQDFGLNNPAFWAWSWFAWLGWLVVVVQVLHIRLDLGERFCRPKPFEKNGYLYERLGVRHFKKFTVNGEYMNRIVRFYKPNFKVIRDVASMKHWLSVTRSKEAGHIVHFVMTLPALGYLLMRGYYLSAGCLIVLNILFDLYPVMIQRYNRFRIQRILRKYLADR